MFWKTPLNCLSSLLSKKRFAKDINLTQRRGRGLSMWKSHQPHAVNILLQRRKSLSMYFCHSAKMTISSYNGCLSKLRNKVKLQWVRFGLHLQNIPYRSFEEVLFLQWRKNDSFHSDSSKRASRKRSFFSKKWIFSIQLQKNLFSPRLWGKCIFLYKFMSP